MPNSFTCLVKSEPRCGRGLAVRNAVRCPTETPPAVAARSIPQSDARSPRNGESGGGGEPGPGICTAPGLRPWLRSAHHVLAHAGCTDVDAEFEPFAVNARRSPKGVVAAHLASLGRHPGATA